MKREIKNIEKEGYVEIEYPKELREVIVKVAETWKGFCALDEDQKSSYDYNARDGMGVGYEIKKGDGPHIDLKENFNFTYGEREWLRKAAEKVGDPIALQLVDEMSEIVELLVPIVEDFARKSEEEFGLEGFVSEVMNARDTWFIRFAHYFSGCDVGTETATAHIDKSGFTPHLFESDLGLERLDMQSGEWLPMPVSGGETVIIPSMQMQYRSGGKIKANCHRVVANEKTVVSGRYSAVCFVPLLQTPRYDKQREGRLQEMKPGFNYSMPFEEFSKLFK